MEITSASLIHSISRNAGGMYESVRHLVHSLERENVGVHVFGTRDEHTVADGGRWAPVKLHVFEPVWPRSFGFAREYGSELEDYAPDLVHTHGIWLYPSRAARRYCRLSGARSIISPHGMLDPWAVSHSQWKKKLAYTLFERAHLENADCFRALCVSEAESIRTMGLKKPIAVIPNGIDLPSYLPWVSPLWTGRVSPGRKVLLYLGRIHPKKGLPELFRAWAAFSREDADDEWLLVICGWDQGGHEDALKALSDDLALSWKDLRCLGDQEKVDGRVLFVGPQFGEGKKAIYQHSDAFVLPSYSEGLPMTVLEAWAYDLPVLITPECNLPEAFASGAAIRIGTNPAAILEGFRQLDQLGPALTRDMVGQGKKLIEEKFNWQTIGRQMKSLYEWTLGGGPDPSSFYRESRYRAANVPAPSNLIADSIQVAFVISSISRNSGGIGLIARSLGLELRKLDTFSTVFALEDSYSALDRQDWGQIPINLSPPQGPSGFGFSPPMKEKLMGAEVDLLHVHGLWQYPGIAAFECAGARGLPRMVTIHGMLEPWALGNSRWKKEISALLYEKKNLQSAQCLHVNTKAEMASVRAFGLTNPVAVIPNGVFFPKVTSGEKTNSDGKRNNLLFIGRIHPKKGIAELLQSWSRMADRQGWHLTIAGWDDGGHEKSLREMTASLNLSQSVTFAGPVFGDEKEALFRGADAFVLPSFSEGLPMAVLEAWSYALPVLMTPECNIPEGFTEGAALKIAPNQESIFAGLETMMKMSAEDLAEIGRRGRSLVEKDFTWEKAASLTNEVYNWLLGKGSQPAFVYNC